MSISIHCYGDSKEGNFEFVLRFKSLYEKIYKKPTTASREEILTLGQEVYFQRHWARFNEYTYTHGWYAHHTTCTADRTTGVFPSPSEHGGLETGSLDYQKLADFAPASWISLRNNYSRPLDWFDLNVPNDTYILALQMYDIIRAQYQHHLKAQFRKIWDY